MNRPNSHYREVYNINMYWHKQDEYKHTDGIK